jgi:translation initiation factor 4G
MAPNQRGGYPAGPGRGRGYNQHFNQPQQHYSPQQSFRGPQNNRGGYGAPSYPGRGQQLPYGSSPGLPTRSPAPVHAQPGTPNMGGQIHMVQGGMPPQPNGYYMGPHNVKKYPSFSSRDPARESARGRGKSAKARGRGSDRAGRGRGNGRGGREEGSTFSRDPASDKYRADLARIPSGQVAPELVQLPPIVIANMRDAFPFPDLSPASGNFEPFLTAAKQGYQNITQADPSIQISYMQQMQQMGQFPGGMQGQYSQPYQMPQSPRPLFNQNMYAPNMQPSYSNQGGPPPSMSRQSSQISAPDRPGSSIGQQPATPAPTGPPQSARTPSISAPKSSFVVPTKKSSAIVIKNASGEVVNFNKPPASPATSTPVSTVPPEPTPTPPSRTASAADNTVRTDTAAAKSADDVKKAMQEAVAKKIAADEAKIKQEKELAEKAEMEKEAAKLAEHDAAEAKTKAVELEEEAKVADKKAEPTKVEAPAAEEKKAEDKPAPVSKTDDDEIDLDALAAEMEAEEAAREAEELRKEEEYNKKKAAQREAQRKKEEEEAAQYEQKMKDLEREAEELEIAREKERENGGGSGDEASKKMFAELKRNPFGTPASTESPAGATPAESGTATPVSDVSMPPPATKAPGRRSKAADLTLDTKKPVEPPEPSATLKSLQSAKKLDDISRVSYPAEIASPNPALNANAPAERGFKYNKEFLLQFQSVFKEKPTLDWDLRIRDALGDGDASARPSASARTPSGMGGRNPSARGTAPMNFGPMGNFGGIQRPPLPPGTTSEQRFAISNQRGGPGPMAGNPFAQFGRPGGQMPPPMGRQPSNNPMGPIPGSPRVGTNRGGSGRNESKRGKQPGRNAADEKAMPLTAGMQIGNLETSATGWKPRSVGQSMVSGPALGGEGLMEPDVVQRKTKSLLNKMTPEKFDKITDQILEITAQSKQEDDGRTLRQVIALTFEKATDEAHWASMYAQFCRRMLESMSSEIRDEGVKDKNGAVVTGGNLFRKYLLNRCQEEFERGWKVNLPKPAEGQTEEAAMLSDEYYVAAAAKRRGLGLVRFIGELFKLQMLTERIMHECVKKLVDYEGTPDEAEIESLTSLLNTVGRQLDDPESKNQPRMNIYFDRITTMMNLPDLPSRLKFMLMDVVDLRSKGWNSKADNKGPKTIAEIREEAERAAHEAELKRIASQNNRGGGRMPMGRGDARNFSYGQVPPPDNSNRVGTDDLRRLGAGRNTRNASNNAGPVLGGPSLMGGRTNSGRRGLGPGGLLGRGEDSGNSSRTGTPPAQKEIKKDESSTNAFR